MWKLRPAILLFTVASALPAAGRLEIYCIDVEGGKATLWISPSGESMLVDAGWAGHNHRDAERIAEAAKAAGVRKIDYLVITSYQADHAGGVPQLAGKMSIRNFVDHGATVETGIAAETLYGEYLRVRDKGTHIVAQPGDTLPIKGMDVKIVSAGGDLIASPLAGAGLPNPDCAGYQPPPPDQTESARSIGLVVTYGSFRAVDLGDLTKDREFGLVCPQNKLGTVGLFLVSHHGMDLSNSVPLVHALHPRVAILDDGARRGGAAKVWQTLHGTPGLEDFWQLHYAVEAGKDHNSPDPFLANLEEDCEGQWLRVTAEKDGTFTVFNHRNKFARTYKAQ